MARRNAVVSVFGASRRSLLRVANSKVVSGGAGCLGLLAPQSACFKICEASGVYYSSVVRSGLETFPFRGPHLLVRNIGEDLAFGNPPEWTKSRFCSSVSKSTQADGVDGPVPVEYSSLLEEEQFHDLADDVLHRLQEKIEVYGEDLSIEGFDSDYASGVLTVRLGSLGTYVLNKQTPNRQIWLSSPVSGPGRFDWSNSTSSWIYRRTNAELVSLLQKEFSSLLQTPINLS